jgi:RND family efflux transporter MFP subunit
VIAFIVLASALVLASGCSKPAEQTKILYTCGMHPQVIQDHPGNCPICGMKLTPVHDQTGGNALEIDPATIQNMGLRTDTVTRGPLRRTIRTVGVIDYNEAAISDVTTKFKGWIEKLYANTTGQLVMRGDPLFEIYSPDLYNAQVEYLLATKLGTNGLSDSQEMATSARTKLKFFDISDAQIAALDRDRQPQKTLRIVAPQDGFVTEKTAVEGQMVDAGMRTYRLADLGLVWVQAEIYEQDLAYVKLGQEAKVTVSYLTDREFRGRVTYIYPTVDEKTRTARVRMEFHNPGYFLKPGMFATVQITSELEPSALLIPDMAILRSGEKATVFVALDGGKFEPRTVILGPQGENDSYQVLSGLSEGERIVTSGQFMLDSESQLREAIQKMHGTKEGALEPATNSGTLTNQMALASGKEMVKYICPMPEHVSIEYEHPGKCPICGMTLVPVSAATLEKLAPGGKLLYYTCPMPEHSDIHYDKPGNCPKCGMTLIPVMEPPKLFPAATNMTMPEQDH